jgi:threonine synthase
MEMTIACTNCRRPYPVQGAPHRCPQCGGLLDVAPWEFDLAQVDTSQPGLWRYRHTFTAIDPHQAPVTLGEGLTPLLWAEAFGRQVAFKAEHLNPTGSFKDRGSALIATFLQGRGILQAVEDSSGNAGASFAAYAARAGMQAHIYVPEAASGPKRGQIENYGAHIHPIPGTRADVTSALERDLRPPGSNPVAYASHAALPVNLPGYATAAYEIYEQLGSAPGAVLCPVGRV